MTRPSMESRDDLDCGAARPMRNTGTASRKPSDRRLMTSFRCAFSGIWAVLKTQRNARIHLAVIVLVTGMGLWLRIDRMEWIIIALLVVIVFMGEMFNSALECVTDLVTEEYHPLAKRAKDVAAGAVLLGAIVAVLVGIGIFLPRLLEKLL